MAALRGRVDRAEEDVIDQAQAPYLFHEGSEEAALPLVIR